MALFLKCLAALIVLLLVWGGCVALRARALLAQTSLLEAKADRFSKDYYLGNPADPPALYAVLGDSTAEGVGADNLEQTYPYAVAAAYAKDGNYVHVLNFAVSGARAADVERSQIPRLKGLSPLWVLLAVGANDATHLTPAASYAASLDGINAALQATGAKVLVATTPDTGRIPALPFPYNVITRSYAKRQNRQAAAIFPLTSITVDLFNDGALDAGRDPGLYAADRFHPSSKGYAVWAKLFVTRR